MRGSLRISSTGFGISGLAVRAHIAATGADHLFPFVRLTAITAASDAFPLNQSFRKNLTRQSSQRLIRRSAETSLTSQLRQMRFIFWNRAVKQQRSLEKRFLIQAAILPTSNWKVGAFASGYFRREYRCLSPHRLKKRYRHSPLRQRHRLPLFSCPEEIRSCWR